VESLFALSVNPLPAAPPFPVPTGVGAIACFEGIVRDNNEGKSVVRLEYSAYPKLAEREGTRIVRDASSLGRKRSITRAGAAMAMVVAKKTGQPAAVMR
jgi:molybdopterin synthase catalytic subunit